MSNDKMREEFEAWARDEYPKMSPGYFEWVNEYSHYAIDEVQFAWDAWQAARAQHVDAIDTLSECVEKHCENRHDCQPAGEAVAWMDKYGELYHEIEDPCATDVPLYTAPPVKVPDVIEMIAWQWDGCEYDADGMTIDIGESIRESARKLAADLHPKRV